MRYALFALLFAAGCYGQSIHPPEEPSEEPGPGGTEIVPDPNLYDQVKISELGTERVRPIAKTIEWPAGEVSGKFTEVGDTFRGDAVVVDHVFRGDSNNDYEVRVRVKNTTPEVLKLEYLIRFYTRKGGRLIGWVGGIGAQERWQGFVLEPLRYSVLTDYCKVMGAEGFRLFIRAKGAAAGEDGAADDPAKKEERRQQREAAARKP